LRNTKEKGNLCVSLVHLTNVCSDEYGAVTSLPKLFETLVLESIQLVKEAVLAIDNREDDILDQPAARTNTQLLLQKVSRLRTVTDDEAG
jgi:hypothetical protein